MVAIIFDAEFPHSNVFVHFSPHKYHRIFNSFRCGNAKKMYCSRSIPNNLPQKYTLNSRRDVLVLILNWIRRNMHSVHKSLTMTAETFKIIMLNICFWHPVPDPYFLFTSFRIIYKNGFSSEIAKTNHNILFLFLFFFQ